jgi:hypothetical protein
MAVSMWSLTDEVENTHIVNKECVDQGVTLIYSSF